jgi:hypothetical protein
MKKIIQKTTRAFSVPSVDQKSAKAKSAASRRSSFAIEHILFTEEDLLEQAKKIMPKKTSARNASKDRTEEQDF